MATAIEVLLKELRDRLTLISSPDLDSDLSTRMLRRQLSSFMATAKSYIPLEKQHLQSAWDEGFHNGNNAANRSENVTTFDQFYSQLKGE